MCVHMLPLLLLLLLCSFWSNIIVKLFHTKSSIQSAICLCTRYEYIIYLEKASMESYKLQQSTPPDIFKSPLHLTCSYGSTSTIPDKNISHCCYWWRSRCVPYIMPIWKYKCIIIIMYTSWYVLVTSSFSSARGDARH